MEVEEILSDVAWLDKKVNKTGELTCKIFREIEKEFNKLEERVKKLEENGHDYVI